MFRKLFGKNSGDKKTGIYKFEGDNLIELDECPGNGSINGIIEGLGYSPTQVHTVLTFDSKVVEFVGVKVFSKEVVFVRTKDKNSKFNLRILLQELSNIDWDFEYSRHTIEDILNEGIEAQNLTFEFLSSVVQLKQEEDSLYLAPTLDLYLNFKDGILEGFTSSEWSNTASKWLKDLNNGMFDGILSEAMKYHRNEIEAMEEVNLQCDALQRIPNGINNEFIPLHVKSTTNVNFFNLLAAHYNQEILIDEFKLVNKGRLILMNELTLEVDKFVFRFDDNGLLTEAIQK